MRSWKWWWTVGAAGALAAVLTGCTVASAPSQTPGADGSPASQNQTSSTQPGNSANGDGASSDVHSLPATKPLTYSLEGMSETHSAKLFRSPQGYYIYVLDTYKFSPEEPRKDVVTLSANPNAWMRIEMLGKAVDLKDLNNQAKQFLQATGTPVQEDVAATFQDPYMKSHTSAFWHASSKTTVVGIYIQKIDGVYFRFTSFLPTEFESSVPLWAMMATIGVLNAH